MFRALLLVFLTVAAAEAACEGEHCAIQDGSTAGSVMLQVKSAKSAAQVEDVEDVDNMEDEIGEEDDTMEEMEDEDLEAIEEDEDVMLQVKAAKPAAQLEDVEDEDNMEDDTGKEDDMAEEMSDEDMEAIEEDEGEIGEEDDMMEEMEDEAVEAIKQDKEKLAALETERRPRKGRRSGRGKKKAVAISADDKAACPSGGRLVDGKCWHLSLPATSCEETCVEKDLQYDEGTDLGTVTRINVDAKDKCLGVAAKFGFPGQKQKLMQWSGQGCGCVVYKVPAYGLGDEVRLNHGNTNAQCAKTSTITARLCACKKAAAIGGSCTSSSGCTSSYCKSGVCTKLLATDGKCSEHASCTTGYCSPSGGKCTTLAWKSTQGAFARSYRKSGAKRSKKMTVPNWEEMTKFPKGFCLGYYPTSTGCMIARGIDRTKTIEKAKQRCAQSAECKAVWCCATACPASTCYAVKAETPNYKEKDCPDAPGSFHETKYANTFYTKDAEGKAEQEDEEPVQVEDVDEGKTAEKEEALDAEGKAEQKDKEPVKDSDEIKTEEKEEAPEEDAEAGADEGEAGKIYKQVKTAAMCKFGKGDRYTRLKSERTVQDCAEAVKQRNGLAFAFMERKKICVMPPKPLSECSMRKGKWDFYELEAGAGDEDLEQED